MVLVGLTGSYGWSQGGGGCLTSGPSRGGSCEWSFGGRGGPMIGPCVMGGSMGGSSVVGGVL